MLRATNIIKGCDGTDKAEETPIGYMPTAEAIDRSRLESQVTNADMEELLSFDRDGWLKEVDIIKERCAKFGNKLLTELRAELTPLEKRLSKR